MGEFEYRGYRIRTIFEKEWRVKIWPPLRPAQAIEHINASRAEGERHCAGKATAAIDRMISSDQKLPRPNSV